MFVCAELIGQWDPKLLHDVVASVETNELQQKEEEASSKMLEHSFPNRGNSLPNDESPVKQSNPQTLRSSQHQDDSSKLLESSASSRYSFEP